MIMPLIEPVFATLWKALPGIFEIVGEVGDGDTFAASIKRSETRLFIT